MKSSETSGIAILSIGIALLVTTFIDAYLFLKEGVTLIPIHGLMAAFSKALAPLIESSIRIIYLAIMGWIGSTLTMRGITVLSQVKLEAKPKVAKRIKTKAEPKDEPKDLQEAWEMALHEAKIELKPRGKSTGV